MISEDAIRQMIKEDPDKAYFVLGEAYKTDPTYASLHNLGAFLSKYGDELTFSPRGAKRLAKKLLLSAKEQRDSFMTNKELGDLCLSEKQYRSAIRYYTTAYRDKQPFDLCHHLAECFFYRRQYPQMKALLAEAADRAGYSGTERAALNELYGFSCVFDGDVPEAVRVLRSLQTDEWYSFTPDTLKLAFLCGEYAFILQSYAAVYAEWIIEPEDYRIVRAAFQKAGADRSEEFCAWREREVVGFCAKNPDMDTTELMGAVKEERSPADVAVTVTIPYVFSCEFY